MSASRAHAFFFNSLALQQLFAVFFWLPFFDGAQNLIKPNIRSAPLIGGSGGHLV